MAARIKLPRQAPDGSKITEFYLHKKTGGIYRFDSLSVLEANPAIVMVRYWGRDRTPWLRPYIEFFDGRFQSIPDPVPSLAIAAVARQVKEEMKGLNEKFWEWDFNAAQKRLKNG